MSADSTNLASEFFILSTLHRLGAEATLTLANKKSVDIVVVRDKGSAATMDVKGAAGTTGWFVDNVTGKANHFIVFVSYLNRIGDLSVSPEVYIVPSKIVTQLARVSPSGKKVIHLSALRKRGQLYRDRWKSIISDR
jgi:hypothetical protein